MFIFLLPEPFLSVRIDFDTGLEALCLSPRLGLVPGGMFLCREATSLSYLPVISVGRQGTTPSLAPEPQASPGHQTAAPHSMCSLRVWLFRVCRGLLVPECVKKPSAGWRSICKIWFNGLFRLASVPAARGLPHKAEPARENWENHKETWEG